MTSAMVSSSFNAGIWMISFISTAYSLTVSQPCYRRNGPEMWRCRGDLWNSTLQFRLPLRLKPVSIDAHQGAAVALKASRLFTIPCPPAGRPAPAGIAPLLTDRGIERHIVAARTMLGSKVQE